MTITDLICHVTFTKGINDRHYIHLLNRYLIAEDRQFFYRTKVRMAGEKIGKASLQRPEKAGPGTSVREATAGLFSRK